MTQPIDLSSLHSCLTRERLAEVGSVFGGSPTQLRRQGRDRRCRACRFAIANHRPWSGRLRSTLRAFALAGREPYAPRLFQPPLRASTQPLNRQQVPLCRASISSPMPTSASSRPSKQAWCNWAFPSAEISSGWSASGPLPAARAEVWGCLRAYFVNVRRDFVAAGRSAVLRSILKHPYLFRGCIDPTTATLDTVDDKLKFNLLKGAGLCLTTEFK